jgi:anti-sigma-K factor RskA
LNVKDYISSGMLEAYVLGELSESERSEVEKNLMAYPELKDELSRIEEVQEALLMRMAVKPSASVKEKLMSQITSVADAGNVVPLQRERQISFWRFAAAASVTIALVMSFLAYNYHSKWQTTQSDLSTLLAQNQQVAQNYNQVNERLERMENDLRIIDNPKFQRVIMTGTANAPEAMASVYWNESTQEVFLSIQNMKTLARENQYQLWAIIGGKPVDAGVFDGNVAGLHKMKQVSKGAVVFAVTVEPRGGKPSPTLETMQVKGEVQKT